MTPTKNPPPSPSYNLMYGPRLTKGSSALTTPLLPTESLREEERKCRKHYKKICE